jgi:CRP-like cAMP-binding protein
MGVTLELFRNEPDAVPFAAGATIFTAGDAGDAMYVVLDGEVDLHIRGGIVDTLGPGEPFGEMALVDRSPRIATAVAKTDCRLAIIPEKRFLFMVQQTPFFSLQIMRVMADRLRRMDARHTSSTPA